MDISYSCFAGQANNLPFSSQQRLTIGKSDTPISLDSTLDITLCDRSIMAICLLLYIKVNSKFIPKLFLEKLS